MAKSSLLLRVLSHIENTGNRLPHPTALFIWLCGFVIAISWILASAGITEQHPTEHHIIAVRSLLSVDGLHFVLNNTVGNFTSFAPVGTVLVAILGLGIAEKSGLLAAVMTKLVRHSKGYLLSGGVVFAGVMSSLAADSGYVILIPLAGILFANAGKHPIAGMAAAFAGVSGGYGANLLIGPVDAILAGISTESAHLVDKNAEVNVLANYYFMIASTLLVTVVGTLLTEKLTLPRLPVWSEETPKAEVAQQPLRALRWSALIFIVLVVILVVSLLPDSSPLRDPATGSITRSPFMSGIISIIALIAALSGLTYGYCTGRYGKKGAVIADMEASMATMAGYLVLMFFAAQFVNYFAWSNIGIILAIKAAFALQSLALSPLLLLVSFILITAAINLLIGSASAKWSVLGPVFIPMFMLLGVAPESTQAAYRIGDSSTNIITPMMPYFGVVIAFMQRYDPKLGVGTVITLMLPYSLCFLVSWSALLSLWLGFGLKLGAY